MTIKILLDHDIEGYATFLQTGLKETGWHQYLSVQFIRLNDLGLPDDYSDKDIWRQSQADGLLLITHNRNRDDETSLQATIERESGPDSLPVITISTIEKLALRDYRQQAVHKLAEIIIYLDNYRGTGRIYIP